MTLRKRFHCWILSWSCPNFYEHFPKENKDGDWVAVAIRTTIGSRREKETALVKTGLFDAYIKARALALKWDGKTPYADGEYGIEYAIRRPKENEIFG